MSPVWLCRCIAFGPILNSLAVVFWAPPSRVCWSTFHLLSYPLTRHPAVTSPMSPLALRLCWIHYVQRQCSPLLYPSELTVSNNATTCFPGPNIIPADGSTDACNKGSSDEDSSPSTSSPLQPPPPPFDFKSVLDHLHSLANAVQDLSRPVTLADLTVDPLPPTTLLSALPPDKIVELFQS